MEAAAAAAAACSFVLHCHFLHANLICTMTCLAVATIICPTIAQPVAALVYPCIDAITLFRPASMLQEVSAAARIHTLEEVHCTRPSEANKPYGQLEVLVPKDRAQSL